MEAKEMPAPAAGPRKLPKLERVDLGEETEEDRPGKKEDAEPKNENEADDGRQDHGHDERHRHTYHTRHAHHGHGHGHTFATPVKRIVEGPDVARFLVSKAYRDIGLFVLQLNHGLCPRTTAVAPAAPTAATTTIYTLDAPRTDPPSVCRLQQLLARLDALVDAVPPDPGPRRFGNVSFRTWHSRLGAEAEALLREYVPLPARAVPEILAYFLGSFGSAQRLDYGTGHELSFLAFLGCLWKVGVFADGPGDDGIERSIVLGVLEPYFQVMRKIILAYTLEPAGSHGVWGLDDHFFLSYIFGSAQLTRPIPAAAALAAAAPVPQEGSAPRAPKPSDVLRPASVATQRHRNLYFAAIGFIDDVKKGPFWEHSPILFDVSGIADGWGKINKGMIKMYNAEVLSKYPVVQHFPFGSLFSWDVDPEADVPTTSMHMANQPMASAAGGGGGAAGAGTAAPWAQATRMPAPTGPGIPYSRVPRPTAPTAGTAAPWAVAPRRPGTSAPGTAAPGASVPGASGGSAPIGLTRAPWAT